MRSTLISFNLFILATIKFCYAPNSYEISLIQTIQGTWEDSSNGAVPEADRMVVGAIDPIDNEHQYRRSGKEHGYSSSYQILVNRDGYEFEWQNARGGNFPHQSVIGGYASGWPMIVCRAWHKGRQGRWRYVSGKLDPEPGFECCYIPYGGKEHCYKEYQVLKNKY